MIKETFFELIAIYSKNAVLANDLWYEIELKYSSKNRFYHTLNHLENLLNQLKDVKSEIEDWKGILFTLYYHDIIYKASKFNNEEKSAEFAVQRMEQLLVSKLIIGNCKNQILATKNHSINENSDTNYFIDADLSILGHDWNSYSNYYQNVRKEYSIYPDLIYNNGRKKFLKHFLSMQKIFKTEFFYQKFESNSRLNLQKEFDLL